MKTPRWIRKLEEFLSEKSFKELREKAAIKKLLRKLRKRHHELKKRLSDEKDARLRKRISKSLAVVHAQRKKGVKRLRKISQSRKK